MKTLAFVIASLVTINAFADYANITCESEKANRKVTLQLDETSDVQKETVGIAVNDKSPKISKVQVKQTEYGILAINVEVGQGPGKYSFRFKNLGAASCFGVYGAKTDGDATVEVINSLGVIAKLPCTCEAD